MIIHLCCIEWVKNDVISIVVTRHIELLTFNSFRACFKILPKILCFNTMRYTFNMLTMMKEKVNTHFSFPLRLDMSGYMEENLISTEKLRGEYM